MNKKSYETEFDEVEFKRGLDVFKKTFYGTDIYEYLDGYGKYLFNRRKKIYLKKDGTLSLRTIHAFWVWFDRTHF